MNILHISNTPLSRSPENIASCQRFCGHQSRVLLHRTRHDSSRPECAFGGELWSKLGRDHVVCLFESAEIIHMHNLGFRQEIFKAYPELIPVTKSKPCLIQYHSDRYAAENFEDSLSDPFFRGRKAVLAQYHPRIYPECEHIVGNPIPLHEEIYQAQIQVRWSQRPPVVSFAPSNLHLKGWDYKGCDKILPVLTRLSQQRLISKDVIQGVPYEQCLIKKKWAQIGIEELVSGSYHLSFLEYMAMGCVTIGNLDPQTLTALHRLIGDEAMEAFSFQHAFPETLDSVLRGLVLEPQHLQELGLAARKWIQTYWSPAFHAKVYERVYSSL